MVELTKRNYLRIKEKVDAYPSPINEEGYTYKWVPKKEEVEKYILNEEPEKIWPFVEYILSRAMDCDLDWSEEDVIEILDRYLDENIQII